VAFWRRSIGHSGAASAATAPRHNSAVRSSRLRRRPSRSDSLNGGKDGRRGVKVLDRFSVGFLPWAMARPSSSASIHRRSVLTGRRGSGKRDWAPAYHARGGSAFGTPDTSTVDSTHSVRTDDRRAGVGSCPRMEQPTRRVIAAKSLAFCGRGVHFFERRGVVRITREAIANSPQPRSRPVINERSSVSQGHTSDRFESAARSL